MTFTSQEYAAHWVRRQGLVNPEVRRAVRRLAGVMLANSVKHMQADIYEKPEDVRPRSGNKKWVRTGLLLKSEGLNMAPDGAGFTLVNTADYAEPRHEANKPGRRKINPARTAHWRDETVADMRLQIPLAFAAMNLRILRAGEP